MSAKYPQITVVDARSKGYDAEAFCSDAVHLNRRGANALSREIGDILRHRLGGSSKEATWVSLPLYRPGPFEVDLEDMNRSRAVIRDVKVRR
jgi:hypothetical protein